MNTSSTQRSPGVTTPVVLRFQIALSFLAFVLIGANDGAFGVLIPGIRGHYRIDNTTIGLIFLCATLGYLLASFNMGLLVEKLGIRRFLLLGAATYLLCALVISLTPPFVAILVTYLFLGTAVAALDAGLNVYIARLPNNTTLLNYLHAFYGVGAWLGPFVASGLLALQWRWNNIYLIWAGLSLLVLVGFASRFSAHATTTHDVETEEPDKSSILLAPARLRVVWIAAFFLFFYVGAEVSASNWGYSFLTDGRHIVPLFAGWMISGYWLGLTLGRIVLGHLGQRTGQVRLIQMSLVGVLISIALLWILPGAIAAACVFFVLGFSLGPIFPTVIALMSRLVTPRILPGAVGFVASFANIGAALCSWSTGSIIQHVGSWSLLLMEVGVTCCMIVLWFMLHARRRSA